MVLTVVPLPTWLAIVRPAFLVLAVLYWSIMIPRAGGVLLGFAGGLALDVFQGSLLGEHALALAFVTYLAIRLHLLMRAKPLFEQSLFVFAALMVYEFAAVGDRWLERPSAVHAVALGAYADRRPDLAASSSGSSAASAPRASA